MLVEILEDVRLRHLKTPMLQSRELSDLVQGLTFGEGEKLDLSGTLQKLALQNVHLAVKSCQPCWYSYWEPPKCWVCDMSCYTCKIHRQS